MEDNPNIFFYLTKTAHSQKRTLYAKRWKKIRILPDNALFASFAKINAHGGKIMLRVLEAGNLD